MTKESIIKEFQKNPSKYWEVDLFKERGFRRKQCELCKEFFWSQDNERKICPDCSGYQFIGQKNTKKKWDLLESWKEFEKFFKQYNHKSIPRYPVVSRWHPDLFFTIASIQDFQRFDNSKLIFEYPTNPLIVPQISIRFNDINNVGLTGRHMTCFQMSGQHAFNDESGKGYWKDKCIELNFEFLTKVMGVPEVEVVYKEDIWAMSDFSAFGPCIESFAKGLEIVNNVFMEFQLSNLQIKELPLKVVDVGWGAERIPWYTQGTPTVYDVTFVDAIDKFQKNCNVNYDKELFLKYSSLAGSLDIDKGTNINIFKKDIASKLKMSIEDLEKKIEPLTAMYAILDHTRTLLFAIADGAIPSNVAGGYNLRVILRRALSFIDKFNWDLKLEDVVFWHVDYLKKLFSELGKHKDEIAKILEVEERRYKQTKERTRRIVESLTKRKFSEDELIQLYDSEGITPEQLGIEVPSDFYIKVTEKHMGNKVEEERFEFDVSNLPETKILYYEPIYEFKARVLKVFKDNFAVLNQTAFYPTSGGQKHDMGTIDCTAVSDVFKAGNAIIHRLFGKIEEGKEVNCIVSRERREILTKHHDAIHIINGAARKILGSHVHQAGADKDIDKARIDITHYDTLTNEQVRKIENLANKIVERNLKIKKFMMKRGDAEQKYGFDIYAGGYVPSREIRIVEIPRFDVEACSGLHGDRTGEVGWITILRTKRIADGIVRIEVKAGDVAVNYLREKELILKDVAERLKVKEENVPKAVERLFDNWKKLRKEKK